MIQKRVMDECMYIHMHEYMYVYLVCLFACVCMYVCMYVCMCEPVSFPTPAIDLSDL